MDPIAVDTSPTTYEATPITVDTGEQPVYALPDNVANIRASKAAFGLGRPQEEVTRKIQGGQEANLRAEVSGQMEAINNKKVNDVIYEVSRRKGGPLTSDEIEIVKQAVLKKDETVEPSGVFESEYSKKYLDVLYGKPEPYTKHWLEPYLPSPTLNIGREYLTKQQILQTKVENLQAAADAQSYVGFGVDIAKNIFSLGMYEEYKERSVIEGTPFFSGLLGTNKEEQRIQLFRQPTDQFTKSIDNIVDTYGKDNPHAALRLLQFFQGNMDKDVDNLWSAINFATFPGVAAVGKGVVRGTARAAIDVPTAIGDVIKSTKSTLPIKVAVNQGVGNLEEAAVQRATAQVVGQFEGTANPLKQIVEALPKRLKEQSIALAENPGRGPGAQEITNRIIQEYDRLQGTVTNVIANFQRGSRIPAPLAAENTIRLMKDSAKENYVGNASRVLDVDGPLKVPHANSLHWEYQIGNHDGTMFGARETAEATARLEGIALQGEVGSARQMELMKLIKQTEFDLSTHAGAQSLLKKRGDVAADLRLKLDINRGTKTPDFEANVKTLQDNLVKYQDELGKLQALPGATIKQQGSHFYISMYEPVVEVDKVTRALLHSTPESRPATGYLNSFLGWARSPEETASKDAMDMAKIAIYGQNKLLELAKSELKEFNDLSRFAFKGTNRKQMFDNVEAALKEGRTNEMYKNVGELQEHWIRNYGRLPYDLETKAYFAAKRYGELTSVFHDLNLYSNENRLGAKTYTLRAKDASGNVIGSDFFKAIERHEIPKNEEGILVMRDQLGHEEIKKTSTLSEKKALNEAVQQGRLRVLEVLYPNDKPLNGFGNIGTNHVKFIVTDKAEVSPLQFTRTDRKGQGMWDLDAPYYLKQANLEYDEASKAWRYKGDKTIMPVGNGGLGKELAYHMDTVRDLIQKGDYGAAKTAALRLPIEWGEHASWYNQTVDNAGKISPAKLNMNEPIRLVPGNQLIINMDDQLKNRFASKEFRDDTRGNLILKNIVKGEQDTFGLYTIRNEGTRNNPLYKYEPANYIDPLPSMNRAMKSIVNSVYMDDYKKFTIEHWIQQAGTENLKATAEQLAHSPEYYFFHGEFRPGTPKDVISRLTDAKWKAQSIWGTPSSLDTQLHAISQHMYDSVYEKGGLSKLQVIPAWALANGKDAMQTIRSAAFHAIIGLWSIPQFVVQNMGYATIAGLEGFGLAGQGAMAMLLHQWSRKFPQHIDALDTIASKLYLPSAEGAIKGTPLLNWRPGWFKEANEGLINSGFHLVGADHSFMDYMYTAKPVQSGAHTFLDWGTVPFKEGEKSLRFGAWYTAYLKYRMENPTVAMKDQEWREVFSRAELLSGNMSAASKSNLQKGPLAFTTQFLGYSMRLAELVTGKRLEMNERIRLASTYAALFGVSALGLSGFPAGDFVRKAAIDHGYGDQSDAWKQWAMEGIPSQLMHMATGTRLNFGTRYGDPSFSFLRDAMAGDKSTWKILGGATVSSVANTIAAGDGFKRAMLSLIQDTDEHFPLTKDDILQPLKGISSVNNITRFIEALNSGNWMSRKGEILEKDITPAQAAVMSVTGMQSQGASDIQTFFSIDKDRKQFIKDTEEAFLRAGERWIRAQANNDPEQAKDYGKQMNQILKKSGYPNELYGQLFGRLEKSNKSMIEKGIQQLYLGKDIPMGEREGRQQDYRLQQGNK